MVKNIKRIIFHIECEDNPQTVIQTIKNGGYEVGLAIKPETNNIDILPYLKHFVKCIDFNYLTLPKNII